MHLRAATQCNWRNLLRLGLIASCLLTLAGCSSARSWQQPQPNYSYSPRPDLRSQSPAIDVALNMIGKPYRYGAEGPHSFDCSGLVWYSFGQAGYRVPRTSADQFRASAKISLDKARPGDLLFFGSRRNVSHVAIYLGDRTFVHAPSSGQTVSLGHLSNPWYANNFVSAGRLVVP
jgi:cell wall-associated NlpC family hydrolase